MPPQLASLYRITSLSEIVLIEDDDVDIEAVSRSLLRLVDPPHLTLFITANEALRALQGQQANRPADPFMILLDLNLPGMLGLHFLEHIQQDDNLRHAVVFILSVSHSLTDKLAAYDLAVAGYIQKSSLGDKGDPLVSLIRLYMEYICFPS